MKDLLSKKYKSSLWQDEVGDDFMLLKYAEAYRYSEDTIGLFVWNFKMLARMRKMGVIFDERGTDDPLVACKSKATDLPRLIALGAFRARPHLKGRWLEEKKRLLAHKIIPYRPRLK